MTHDELVTIGCRWLSRPNKSKKFGYRGACGVVVPELCTWEREQPDVIGWESSKRRGSFPRSYMIECKTSRGDFLGDLKKPHRQKGSVGLYRWYLCPTGVIKPEELPSMWGLLYTDGKTVRQIVNGGTNVHRNRQGEMSMMYSLLRRAALRGDLQKCFSERWGGQKLLKD